MWTALTIGAGKLITWNDIIFCPQEVICLSEEKPFFSISAREMSPSPVLKLKEFLSRAELETHLSEAENHSPVKTVQRGVYDQLQIDWVQRFQSISLDSKRKSHLQKEVQIETKAEVKSLRMGRALHKPKGGQTHFSDKVRGYLQKKFGIGRKTGRKEDPAQVANDMRNARKTDGTQVFSRMEWLSKLQIQGFFRDSLRRESNQMGSKPSAMTTSLMMTKS